MTVVRVEMESYHLNIGDFIDVLVVKLCGEIISLHWDGIEDSSFSWICNPP